MSTAKPKPAPTPALYSPAYFAQERSQGTTDQRIAARILIEAQRATETTAARHKRASYLAQQAADLAATAEAHRNEAQREHDANLEAQRRAHEAARQANALPEHLPAYYYQATR